MGVSVQDPLWQRLAPGPRMLPHGFPADGTCFDFEEAPFTALYDTDHGFSQDGFFGRGHHRGFRDWELELQSYADQRGLSFIAWNFSASWEPALLTEIKNPDLAWPYEPNEAGNFFSRWMQIANAARIETATTRTSTTL